MSFTSIAKHVEKFTVDNSPAILSAVAVTGTVTTAFLTGKATLKATTLMAGEVINGEESYGAKEFTRRHWKLYIPPVATGALTIACIVGANRIGTRRAAAMAAAYSLSERAFSEYREKIIEKLGATKEQAARDDLAQDRVKKNPVSKAEVIVAGGDVLCYEAFTGRYFKSDMETLKKAQNDLNYKVLNDYYASLSDFYELLGLPRTSISEDLGWNCDKMLELEFSTVMSDDGRPCISIEYHVEPIRDYYRIH